MPGSTLGVGTSPGAPPGSPGEPEVTIPPINEAKPVVVQVAERASSVSVRPTINSRTRIQIISIAPDIDLKIGLVHILKKCSWAVAVRRIVGRRLDRCADVKRWWQRAADAHDGATG